MTKPTQLFADSSSTKLSCFANILTNIERGSRTSKVEPLRKSSYLTNVSQYLHRQQVYKRGDCNGMYQNTHDSRRYKTMVISGTCVIRVLCRRTAHKRHGNLRPSDGRLRIRISFVLQFNLSSAKCNCVSSSPSCQKNILFILSEIHLNILWLAVRQVPRMNHVCALNGECNSI